MTQEIQNRWLRGPTRFEIPVLENHADMRAGLFPLTAILDSAIGEETILVIYDETPYLSELRLINPFQLKMKNGCARNDYGSLIFILFWLENPLDKCDPLAMWEYFLDPKNETHMRPWRLLANQTHLHLVLVAKNGQSGGFFEFVNNFGLADALPRFDEACRNIDTIDFSHAKSVFMEKYTIDDVFQMR